MSVTQKELKTYLLGLKGAIYVWGANGQKITKAVIDNLYKSYGSARYNKSYYYDKLYEGQGRIGADCSGMLKPISGYDTTAKGYYNKCVTKGKIDTIPRNKVCLVFKRNLLGKITHVGGYTADGYVCEMASSVLNYQRKELDGNGWTDWGMPNFVSDPEKTMSEKLVIDGKWGKATTIAAQKIYGTTVDGIISNQKISFKTYLPNVSTTSWKFVLTTKSGSLLIKAIQKDLKEKKYYTGAIDGWCGKNTVMGLQKMLYNLGYYKGKIDAKMGRNTVFAWQTYLNSLL